MTIKKRKRTKEEIQYWQDIRRSNAATPIGISLSTLASKSTAT